MRRLSAALLLAAGLLVSCSSNEQTPSGDDLNPSSVVPSVVPSVTHEEGSYCDLLADALAQEVFYRGGDEGRAEYAAYIGALREAAEVAPVAEAELWAQVVAMHEAMLAGDPQPDVLDAGQAALSALVVWTPDTCGFPIQQ